MGQGNQQERAACHPDVTTYCQTQLQVKSERYVRILGCLQANRAKISRACQQATANEPDIGRIRRLRSLATLRVSRSGCPLGFQFQIAAASAALHMFR